MSVNRHNAAQPVVYRLQLDASQYFAALSVHVNVQVEYHSAGYALWFALLLLKLAKRYAILLKQTLFLFQHHFKLSTFFRQIAIRFAGVSIVELSAETRHWSIQDHVRWY